MKKIFEMQKGQTNGQNWKNINKNIRNDLKLQ